MVPLTAPPPLLNVTELVVFAVAVPLKFKVTLLPVATVLRDMPLALVPPIIPIALACDAPLGVAPPPVFPVKVVTAVTGSLAALSVPLLILPAFVVSVVALVANHCQVLSPRNHVLLLAVPLPNLAVLSVPLVISAAVWVWLLAAAPIVL